MENNLSAAQAYVAAHFDMYQRAKNMVAEMVAAMNNMPDNTAINLYEDNGLVYGYDGDIGAVFAMKKDGNVEIVVVVDIYEDSVINESTFIDRYEAGHFDFHGTMDLATIPQYGFCQAYIKAMEYGSKQ